MTGNLMSLDLSLLLRLLCCLGLEGAIRDLASLGISAEGTAEEKNVGLGPESKPRSAQLQNIACTGKKGKHA
jgi:hypothetical protein